MNDIRNLASDLRKKLRKVEELKSKIPKYVAGAAEKMKDANFSAQGFVENGNARPRWKKRKRETRLTQGRRILHGNGTMQDSVKVNALSDRIKVGVGLGYVPYAKLHNEGGNIIQQVRAHTRKHYKTGKRHQVRGFSRKMVMPQRKYLGYSPDIFKISDREISYQLRKIFS